MLNLHTFRDDLASLEHDAGLTKQLKSVRKTLALLESNPRHPSLQTHEYTNLSRTLGVKVLEANAEHRTSAAYRKLAETAGDAGLVIGMCDTIRHRPRTR